MQHSTSIEPVTPGQIELSFVPRPRAEVSSVVVGAETILMHEDSGEVLQLDAAGSIVWACIDGVGTLDEIAADIAAELGASHEQVAQDVLALVRFLGQSGLLSGVEPAVHEHRHERKPVGVEAGHQVESFELPTVSGSTLSLDDLLGQRTLLVNWNPGCGFCARMAPDFAAGQAALEEAGVRLVLIAAGGAERNVAHAAEHGLTCAVALHVGSDQLPVFAGLGTPASYLVDASGRTIGPIAYGADQVLTMLGSLTAPA